MAENRKKNDLKRCYLLKYRTLKNDLTLTAEKQCKYN